MKSEAQRAFETYLNRYRFPNQDTTPYSVLEAWGVEEITHEYPAEVAGGLGTQYQGQGTDGPVAVYWLSAQHYSVLVNGKTVVRHGEA